MHRPKLTFLATLLATAVGLIGAAHAQGAMSPGITIEEQRSTLLSCKRARGVGGAAWFYQSRLDPASEEMAVQIVPYDQVTIREANAINACAAGRLAMLPADNWRPRTIVRSVRYPLGYPNMTCGRNPVVLYRGDLYCYRR